MIKKWIILLLITETVVAKDLDLIWRNNSGVTQFRQKKYLESYQEFLSLLGKSPQDVVVQFNLGSSMDSLGEEEKAEMLYKQILRLVDLLFPKTKDKEEQQELLRVRYATLYNLGTYYMRQQEVDKTLDYYQQALELNPDSKEIKTNIELLWQQKQGGGGQGKDKNDKKEPGDKDGKSDQQQDQEDKGQDRTNKQDPNEAKKNAFDQSQMSMEDLKKIMEELKNQEQKIRSQVQDKGEDKPAPGGKEW